MKRDDKYRKKRKPDPQEILPILTTPYNIHPTYKKDIKKILGDMAAAGPLDESMTRGIAVIKEAVGLKPSMLLDIRAKQTAEEKEEDRRGKEAALKEIEDYKQKQKDRE